MKKNIPRNFNNADHMKVRIDKKEEVIPSNKKSPSRSQQLAIQPYMLQEASFICSVGYK